jgi:leucyl aminopeptidase
MKKHVLRILRFSALALAVALPGGSAPPPSSEIWITLGQEEAGLLLQALVDAVRAGAADRDGGEIVVARIREDRLPLLSRTIHERLNRCGGFVAHESREAAFEAVTRELSLAPVEPLVDYTIDNGPVVQTLLSGIQEATVRGTIETLSAFFTRYHTTQTGQASATWIRDLWAGYAQGRSDVTVQLLSHPSNITPQPSVVLTIQGTTLPGEVVVLGAHQDSINGGAAGRAPGADDDASGVASLSEAIRVAMATTTAGAHGEVIA